MPKETSVVHQVDYESEHITFRSIWHAALVLREAGEKDDSNGFWFLMAAGVLGYTAYEGFVNDLIERVFPEIWVEERTQFVGDYRGTLGKTLFLSEKLDVALERGRRPYSTVAELHAWRNELVHQRTVRVRGITRADAYAKKPKRARPVAFARLERPAFLSRCFADVPRLADVLLEGAREKHGVAVSDLDDIAFSGVLGSGGASLRR